MNTVQEALFKAMLQEEWFTQSGGDVEWSNGYFGWVHNHPTEWFEVSQAFCETLDAYGYSWDVNDVPDWFSGVFFASINSDGIIRIDKIGDIVGKYNSTYDFANNYACVTARKRFESTQRDFIDYNNEMGE